MWLQSFSCLYTVVHFVHTHTHIRVKWQQTRVSLECAPVWYKYYAEQSTRIFLFRCVACNSKWNGFIFAIDPGMNSSVSFVSSIVSIPSTRLYLPHSVWLSINPLPIWLTQQHSVWHQLQFTFILGIEFLLDCCRCSIEN